MPESLVVYWTAWNCDDPVERSALVRLAVAADVVWNDPRDSFVGIAELEANMTRLRVKPGYRFDIVSEVDHHHGRLRYRWEMSRNGRTLMEGLDIATLAESGLIERVDGFFGHVTPIRPEGSGIPSQLAKGQPATPAR